MGQLPALVTQAQVLAQQVGFALTREQAGHGRPSACLSGTGRVLAMLAAGCVGGHIGELGTGAGIGAGWIASAMPASCTLIAVEIDEPLARAARGLLAADPRIEVITGASLRVIPSRGSFDLLFADGGLRDHADFATLVSSLHIGGRISHGRRHPRAHAPIRFAIPGHRRQAPVLQQRTPPSIHRGSAALPAQLAASRNQNEVMPRRKRTRYPAALPRSSRSDPQVWIIAPKTHRPLFRQAFRPGDAVMTGSEPEPRILVTGPPLGA